MRRTLFTTIFALSLGGSAALGQPANPMSGSGPASEATGLIPARCTNGIDLSQSCGSSGGLAGSCCHSTTSGSRSSCYESTTSCCGSNCSCCGENNCWQGAYVGLNIGLGLDSSNASEGWTWVTKFPTGTLLGVNGGPLVTTPAPVSINTAFHNQYHHSSFGLIGGVNAGYNWQSSNLVVGVEADYDLSTQRDSASYLAQPVPAIFPPLPNFFFAPGTTQGWTTREKIDWLATFRGRVGVASDDTLFYLTGGLALGGVRTDYTLLSSTGAIGSPGVGNFAQVGLPGGMFEFDFNNTKVGWCIGTGVESRILQRMGFGPGWTVKIEYLFVDLGTVQRAFGTPLVPVAGTSFAPANLVTGSTSFISSIHVYENMIRLGLNYKF